MSPEGRRQSVSEFRNEVRARFERMFAAVDRWGKAVEASRSASAEAANAAARELTSAEDQLLSAYHEIPHKGS